jgi:hypothetical protein
MRDHPPLPMVRTTFLRIHHMAYREYQHEIIALHDHGTRHL